VSDAGPTRRPNLLLPNAARWPDDQPVIELEGVTKRFGAKVVLEDLSLSITTGKTTVIVGESGSGKSVLLRLMNGLTLPDAGVVRLFGVNLARASQRERAELRKRCTMVFQSYALIDSMTVAENVAFPLRENTRMRSSEIAPIVTGLLELLGVGHAAALLPASLSGGMKKRVALARALVSNP
jgi:ABC-type transporter Mla maintaining outer membrane lipid asymmetry ATPase subunit MlaF